MIEVLIQNPDDLDVPADQQINRWVAAALNGQHEGAELGIRFIGSDESAELNQAYRQKSGPTNVLSFPFENPDLSAIPDLSVDEELAAPQEILGDLVICVPVVCAEASEQGKPIEAHWAHMVVHGVLHLLGYDHMVADEAEVMENLERSILAALGYADPY